MCSLNLPWVYTLPNSSGSGTYILTYFYDADGNKLRRVSTQGTGSNTDYIDGIEYDNGAINFIQTDEGRAVYIGGSYGYEYNLSDYLGNTRVTYSIVSNVATMIQQDDYYPFGMDIQASTTNPENYYLYNKKELQPDLGQYDYGARFYDPVIARWTSVDPLAEKMRRYSTYNYGFDNPIKNTDPDGMAPPDEKNYDTKTGQETTLSNLGTDQGVDIVHFGHADGNGAFAIDNTQVFDRNSTFNASLSSDGFNYTGPSLGPSLSNATDQALNTFNATVAAQAGPVDYNDFGNPNTSLAIGNNVLNGYGAVSGAAEIGAVFDAFKVAEPIELTKSAFGHTFTTHGEEMTNFLTNRASGSGVAQGQFLDNQAAGRFINGNLDQLNNGATSLPMPENFPARMINPDGTFETPTHIRLVPSGGGVKTAYPEIQ